MTPQKPKRHLGWLALLPFNTTLTIKVIISIWKMLKWETVDATCILKRSKSVHYKLKNHDIWWRWYRWMDIMLMQPLTCDLWPFTHMRSITIISLCTFNVLICLLYFSFILTFNTILKVNLSVNICAAFDVLGISESQLKTYHKYVIVLKLMLFLAWKK